MTKQKDIDSKVYQLALPVRKAAQILLKDKLKTQSSRQKVADSLDKSLRTVNSLIYEGKGGFDLTVAALIVAYSLDSKPFDDFLHEFKTALRKSAPPSPADRAWNELDEQMSDHEKHKWAIVMGTYAKLTAEATEES